MICYRPFRNSDPPALAEIWRSQSGGRGWMQPMTSGTFDDLVLAKPYFDRQGLIVAVADEQPVGFAHAGFGPRPDGSSLDAQRGAVCQLMVRPDVDVATVAAGLLRETEAYLRTSGVREIYGGGSEQLAPFYLGLYGGSRLPGVLSSDAVQIEAFQQAGYEETCTIRVLERRMTGFRPVVTREIMQLRRQFPLHRAAPARPDTWWDACLWGQLDTVRYDLVNTATSVPSGSIRFWDMEPLASTWGVHAMGLVDLQFSAGPQPDLLSTYLLGEAMRELQTLGISLVEVQTADEASDLHAACLRLGFEEVDQGIRFRKRV